MPRKEPSVQSNKRAQHHCKESHTYSFCIALTTAFENGAEVAISALIARAKDLFSVGANMQLVSMNATFQLSNPQSTMPAN
jgi:hypothetical protein